MSSQGNKQQFAKDARKAGLGSCYTLDPGPKIVLDELPFEQRWTRWSCRTINGLTDGASQTTTASKFVALKGGDTQGDVMVFTCTPDKPLKFCAAQPGRYDFFGEACFERMVSGSKVTKMHKFPFSIEVPKLELLSSSVRILSLEKQDQRGDSWLNGVRINKKPGGSLHLQFGESYGRPGIKFDCTLKDPLQSGKFGFIQTCQGFREYQRLDGSPAWRATTRFETFLDTGLPFSVKTGGCAQGQQRILAVDGPSTLLRDSCKEVLVDETFTMYVAYNSNAAGGRWVTLGCTTWRWNARAARDNAKAPWKILFAETSADKDFKLTDVQPEWRDNVLSMRNDIREYFAEDNKTSGDKQEDFKWEP